MMPRKSNVAYILFEIFVLMMVCTMIGCVNTAECDRVTPCSGEERLCLRYRCVNACTSYLDCAKDGACVACEETDSCLESATDKLSLRVCIEDEEQ